MIFRQGKFGLIISALFAIGVSVAQPAFAVDETNETLMPKGMWKDPATGLIWDRCSVGQTWNGATCAGEAKRFNWNDAYTAIESSAVGGLKDWQLPTIVQLRTLVRCDKGFIGTMNIPNAPLSGGVSDLETLNKCVDRSVIPTLDQNIFPNAKSDVFWSASPFRNDRFGAWGLGFHTGALYSFDVRSDQHYVRAVRPSQSLGREAYLAFFNQEMQAQNKLKAEKAEQERKQAEQELVAKKLRIQSCLNAEAPFVLNQNEVTQFYGECNANLKIVTGVLVHTNTKENSSDLICYIDGQYKPWYKGDACRNALVALPNYCAYDNYKGQCVNGRADGVGETYNATRSSGFSIMDYESLAGQYKNGKAHGYIRREAIGSCGMLGCTSGGGTEYRIYNNGEYVTDCSKGSTRIGDCEVNYKAEKEASARREAEENRRVTAFRKSVQEGDDTSQGVVVQVKGNLIKIQTNDSQCSQRDYDGNCKNWINTPVEKWFKRSEIYPR